MVARIAVAVLAAIATAVVYARTETTVVDFERGYEGAFVDGFYPRERAEGKFFRWTDGSSFVVFRNLPGRGELSLEATLKTIRPAGVALPELNFTANGVTVHRARAMPGLASYSFAFPSKARSLRLGIESETFEAGGGRTLGVQVLGITLAREEGAPVAQAAVPALSVAVATFLFGAALGSAAGAAAVSAIFLYLLAQGPVAFSGYTDQILMLAAAAFALARASGFVLERKGWLHEDERSRVVALVVVLAIAKLALVSYPLMLSSDADFQANRMSELLRGNWYPTSVTQHDPPFLIPYPVSLYAVAAPVAALGIDRVPSLEIVTALFDVAVSVVLLVLGVRFLDDLRAGMLGAVIYQLVPMNALSFSAGNFTNLFGVAMLTLSFLFLVLASTGGAKRAAALLAVAAALALTAHFGLLIEAAVLFPVWLAALYVVPPPVEDSRKRAVLALAAAFALAFVYYLGYWELVAGQLDRALGGRAASASVSGTYHPAFINEQMGWVFCLTAALGLLPTFRRVTADPFSSSVVGWVLVTALFVFVELASAIEVRYWLQALPVLALASGRYLSRALERGGTGKLAAVAALAYMAFLGLGGLRDVLLFRYH